MHVLRDMLEAYLAVSYSLGVSPAYSLRKALAFNTNKALKTHHAHGCSQVPLQLLDCHHNRLCRPPPPARKQKTSRQRCSVIDAYDASANYLEESRNLLFFMYTLTVTMEGARQKSDVKISDLPK